MLQVAWFPESCSSLAGVPRTNLVQLFANLLYLLCLDQDVAGLPGNPAQWLVDHYAGVRESRTFPLFAGTQKNRAHRGGHAGTDG